MSHIIIQTTDEEFKHYLSKAYADGYARAVKEHCSNTKNEWLTKDEAMKLLNVTSSTLDNLRHKRLIEYNRSSRPFLYSRESLEAYMRSKVIATSHV